MNRDLLCQPILDMPDERLGISDIRAIRTKPLQTAYVQLRLGVHGLKRHAHGAGTRIGDEGLAGRGPCRKNEQYGCAEESDE